MKPYIHKYILLHIVLEIPSILPDILNGLFSKYTRHYVTYIYFLAKAIVTFLTGIYILVIVRVLFEYIVICI